jgi:hypothetical protein
MRVMTRGLELIGERSEEDKTNKEVKESRKGEE